MRPQLTKFVLTLTFTNKLEQFLELYKNEISSLPIQLKPCSV